MNVSTNASLLESFHKLAGQTEVNRNAWHRLESMGFPNQKNEAWKYTKLSGLNREPWEPAETQFEPADSGGKNEIQVGFTNSSEYVAYLEQLKLPPGVSCELVPIEKMKSSIDSFNLNEAENAFAWLNLAVNSKVLFIKAERDCDAVMGLSYAPINDENTTRMPIVFVRCEKNARLRLRTRYGQNKGLAVPMLLTQLSEGANLELFDLSETQANCCSEVHARVERDASFKSFVSTAGGRTVRKSLSVDLVGSGASADLRGIYTALSGQHCDHNTFIRHLVPHASSDQVYKGLIADDGVAIFNGRILVAKDAIKTQSNQQNKNLLLSNRSLVHSKPQLEIYADDVKCAHGSSTGQLQEDELFYFASRGIRPEEATRLLIYGFINDLVLKLEDREFATEVFNSLSRGFLDQIKAESGAGA
jgi:Fe-S cluster assembly protein SufD